MRQSIKTYTRKISILMVVAGSVFIFQGCHNLSYVVAPIKTLLKINQQIRVAHAAELLDNKYKNSEASHFESDEKITIYLEKYLNKKGKKLADTALFTEELIKVSNEKEFDPVFLLAIMKTESSFNPKAIGSVGEIGLMQIKPSTAKWICNKAGIEWKGTEALKDANYNMLVGAAYFKYLMASSQIVNTSAKGRNYIIAYNTGINNLQRLPDSERHDHTYYKKVMKNYSKIYSDLKKISQTL